MHCTALKLHNPPGTHLSRDPGWHRRAALQRNRSRHRGRHWLRLQHSPRRDSRLGTLAGRAAQAVQVRVRAAQLRRRARRAQAALRSEGTRTTTGGRWSDAACRWFAGLHVGEAQHIRRSGACPASADQAPCRSLPMVPASAKPKARLKVHQVESHLLQALPQCVHIHRLLLGTPVKLQASLQGGVAAAHSCELCPAVYAGK